MSKIIRCSIAALVAAAALFAGALPCAGQSATFLDAIRAMEENRVADAARLLTKEIAENPDNDAAYYNMASLLLSRQQDQDIEKAESLYKKAVELSPDNYWYKYTLALFYRQTDRPELCSVLLEELLKTNPKKSDLYFDVADAYLQQNDIDKAISSIERISEIGGKNEMICVTMMDLLMKKGKHKEAYAYLEEYYKDCKSPRLAAMLGDWYQQTYRDSLAMDCYNQAIEMDPAYSPAYYGRANVYQVQRRYDDYFSDMKRFIADPMMLPQVKAEYLQHITSADQFVAAFTPEIDTLMIAAHTAHPNDTTLNHTESIYYYRSSRDHFAIELARQNAALYPDDYSLGFQYMLMLYYCKAYAGVVDQATVLIQKWPQEKDPMIVRGSAFRLLENYDAAIADYEAVAAKAPKDSATIMQTAPALGELYFNKGEVNKSFKQYEKVLKVSPDNAMSLNNYAYYMSLGKIKLKKAKEMSKKTIEQEPDNPTYLDTYAWILHLMGDDVEAKAIFKHAMIYGGKENATILDHYAEVLYSLKEYDLAFIYWNQAKALAEGEDLAKLEKRIKERKQQLENAK